jgi:site-specific DNA-methyltransferase (adenine-specific)
LEEKLFACSNGALSSIEQGNDEYIQEENIGLNKVTKEKNNHPTVKPIKVMEYLCKLVSMPTKITVLDPYMGSGTTGIACNNIGLDFIGIEKDPDYFKIAETRLNYVKEEKDIEVKKAEKVKTAIELFFRMKELQEILDKENENETEDNQH